MLQLERIAELMAKLQQETISPVEQAELDRAMQEGDLSNSRLINRMEKEWVESLIKAYQKGQASKERNRTRLDWPGKIQTPVINLNFRIISAVASIILLICSGLFIYKHTSLKQPAEKVEAVAKQEILPGGDKAVLTLADGSSIILDSMFNGAIAAQGTTKILKTEPGQLAYQASAAAKPDQIFYNTISTPRGGQYKVVLPDGSKVWLNAASSMKFPTAFSTGERLIEITGEAYVEVAHDSKQPFKVRVGKELLEDMGTAFNINAYNDEPSIKTTLVSGKVRIRLDKSTKGNDDGVRDIILKPGQQAQVVDIKNNKDDHSGIGELKMNIVSDVDMDEVISWKNGLTSFKDSDLKSILRKISRWYDVDIECEEDIPERKFTGGIPRNSNLSDLLRVLQISNVHFKVDGRKIRVMK